MMKYNRRNFLQLTGTAATSVLLSTMESFATPFMPAAATAGYSLKVLATNWGFTDSMDAFCAKAKKEGYDGIEHWWPYNNTFRQDELFDALKKHNLEVGFLCGASESNAAEHTASFKKMLDECIAKTKQKPLYINLHSGRDYFSTEDNSTIIEYTLQAAKKSGIPIYHETHRGRMMFAATVTNQFLKKYNDLKLTLDISHWCNVHESMLADQPENVNAALQRAGHIHARIGYQEGPQVSDPRAPEWEYAVKAHFDWWDKIVAQKKQAGEPVTFLTEFGPPLYMQTLPYTLQPLSNQWEINVYMMKLLRKRYGTQNP